MKSLNTDRFTDAQKEDFSANDYFGVASDAQYTTMQNSEPVNHGPSMDLAMELKGLETVQQGGTAPVSVINQYLRAIDGFYQKQINKLTGPSKHNFDESIVFDNNDLDVVTPTFFTYENDPNNEYECMESITGHPNDKFKYCGPTPYYSDFNP